jgi:hypothetical protein
LIEGQFPDYQRIIPKEHETRVVLPVSDFLQAAKTAAVFSRDNSNIVRINVKPGVEAATSGLEHGRDAVRSATERLADIWPDLRAQAEEVVARASEVPHGAAERVSGVASTTGERAQSIGSDVLGRVQETVIPAVGAFVEATRERTAEMTAHGDETVGGVVSTAGEAAERAVAATTSVAKETLATLFWLIAASAVVYFALLSSERRERVKGLLYGAVEQARLLMRDFQGYEEEM